MKRIEDIENMELSELEQASLDGKVEVPSDLRSRTESLIDSLDLSERLLSDPDAEVRNAGKAGTIVRKIDFRRWAGACGIAAAAALLIGVGISLRPRETELVDTFDDPMLAYAEVQKAMQMISGGMQAGVSGVRKGNECMEMPAEILNRTMNRKID